MKKYFDVTVHQKTDLRDQRMVLLEVESVMLEGTHETGYMRTKWYVLAGEMVMA